MKYKIILVLFIIALISSTLLAFNNKNETCETNVCGEAQVSDYFSIFGIKTHYYGIVIFSFMSLLTFFHIRHPKEYKKFIIYLGVIIGAIISIYFIYIQQFVLNTYCKYCLVVDISMLVAFVVIISNLKDKKNL